MIKIDIPMPKSCCDCPFRCYDETEDLSYCYVIDQNVTQCWIDETRYSDCPLKEAEQ